MSLTPAPVKPTEADCAYLAGLLDSAASIQVNRWKSGRKAQVELRLTLAKPRIRMWFSERFASDVGQTAQTHRCLRFVTQKAAQILVHAYPHLIRLRGQAQIVFQLLDSMGQSGATLTESKAALRDKLASKLMAEKSKEG